MAKLQNVTKTARRVNVREKNALGKEVIKQVTIRAGETVEGTFIQTPVLKSWLDKGVLRQPKEAAPKEPTPPKS